MPPETIRRILQRYGLHEVRISTPQKGYRNESYACTLPGGTTYNLIIHKREAGALQTIHRARSVADHAHNQGFPARATADPRITRLRDGKGERYAALYTYLPGTTIPWESYTMEHLKAAGGALSTLHAVLSSLPRGDLPLVSAQSEELLHRMQQYFARPGVRMAVAQKLALTPPSLSPHYLQLFRALETSARQQALHMDFVRGNILFDPVTSAVTGIVDFEKTAWGHPAFDIARTHAFLLVDCKYKPPEAISRYFLRSGYNKRGPARFSHARLLYVLTNFYLTHDFYKFLLHNPYDALADNEHYIRTRAFLLQRDLIRSA